jgi:polypeptide N-acetylgalactosaminyltransferase
MVVMRLYLSRKSRTIRIAFGVLLLLFILYLLSTYNRENSYNFESPIAARLSHRERPKLVTGLGNFEPKEIEEREGPGEGGKPHHLRQDQQNDADQSESEYGMNAACSDEISLDRTILDTRLAECKHWDYPEKLPTTSVIIVFHNEGWSVLFENRPLGSEPVAAVRPRRGPPRRRFQRQREPQESPG